MASSSQSWNYDVFLSFRGTDTHNTFVDHLYSALVHKGINTYKDDQTLPWGQAIGSSLLKAIEESQIAVIVSSENYVGSSWCLQELEYIMKCKDERGLIVMPIFYYIDPSEFRNQKRKYGEAFAKHESENKSVEAWRKALVDAGNLSGYVTNGPETIFIKQIVDTISNRLCVALSSDSEDLIGIEAHSELFVLELPCNYYYEFSGFLISVAHSEFMYHRLVIKDESGWENEDVVLEVSDSSFSDYGTNDEDDDPILCINGSTKLSKKMRIEIRGFSCVIYPLVH